MLTYKEKIFIDKTAINLQNSISIKKGLNIYSYSDICNFLNDLGYKIIFDCSKNSNNENTIYVKFKEPHENINDKEYIRFIKCLFYQIWEITKKKCNVTINCIDNADSKRFVRAMIMPELLFLQSVIHNLNEKGCCNIFKVAKEFNVCYIDVIARGNDMDLWDPTK